MSVRSGALGALACMAAMAVPPLTVAAEPLRPPAIPGVFAAGASIELVREGFDGTEGPLPLPDGSLLFTENRAGRILRIAPDGTTTAFLEQTNGSNSLAMNPAGELVSVQTAQPRVGVIHPPDAARTLAEGFDGAPFRRPNDLVISRRGDIFFTDPGAAAGPGEPPPPTAVYQLSPSGRLARIATDLERPNGIALDPADRVLYVANTQGEWILAFDVAADGTVGARRHFARLAGVRADSDGRLAGGADGLAVDVEGRLYAATAAGVQIFDATGKALGTVALPKSPQNLAFGGPQRNLLYVVGRGAVYRVETLTRGPAARAK